VSADARPSILVTGAAGGLTQVLARVLARTYKLVGIDVRDLRPGVEFPGQFIRVDYTHRRLTEVFRRNRFHALVHLGRIRATSPMSFTARYNLNVMGTRNLLEHCRRYGVRNVVVFSTFHVYGAHPHNHLYILEDEPLRASQVFPELADAIELDNFAKTFSLQHPEVRTILLRPANVIGAKIRNEISTLLRNKYSPKLLGYDPLMQFVHERDIAQALRLALESQRSGVFNVAGEGLVCWSKACSLAGSRAVPIPHPLATALIGGLFQRVGLRFPKHLSDYFRFPVVISDAAFRKEFGYAPEVSTANALGSLRGAASLLEL
jgi:UDP-glucose 4-epimerase